MVKYDEHGQYDKIVCDNCEEPSPPTSDLIIHHGLTGMGWKCLGGKHVCPDCREDAVCSGSF